MDEFFSFLCVLSIMVAFAVFVLLGIASVLDNPKHRAVEVGFAHYDSKSGELIWDDKRVCYVLNSGCK